MANPSSATVLFTQRKSLLNKNAAILPFVLCFSLLYTAIHCISCIFSNMLDIIFFRFIQKRKLHIIFSLLTLNAAFPSALSLFSKYFGFPFELQCHIPIHSPSASFGNESSVPLWKVHLKSASILCQILTRTQAPLLPVPGLQEWLLSFQSTKKS